MAGVRWTLSADSSKAVKGTKEAADGFGKLETQQKSNVSTGMKLSSAMAGINQALELGKKVLGAAERLWDSSAGKVLALSRNVAALGESLAKEARATQVSTEFLEAWRSHIGLATGESAQFADRGLKMIQRTALDASRGLSTATDLFGMFGVEVRKGNGDLKTNRELIGEISKAIQTGYIPETEAAAAVSQLFRDRTGKMFLALKDGTGIIEENERRLRQWGAFMSEELLAASEAYVDSVQRRKEAEQGYINVVAEETLPAMADLNNRFALLLANLSQSRDDVQTWSGAFGDALTWVAEVAVIMGTTFDVMLSEMTIDLLKMERAFLELLQRLAPESLTLADELVRVNGRISSLQDDILQKKNAMAGFLKGTGLDDLLGAGDGAGGGGVLGPTPVDEIEIGDAGGDAGFGIFGKSNAQFLKWLRTHERYKEETKEAKEDTIDIADAWRDAAGAMGGVVSGFDTLIGRETTFLKGLGSIINRIQALQAIITGIRSIGSFFGLGGGIPGIGGIGDRGLMPTVLADRGAGTLPGGGSHSLVIRRNDEVVMDPEGTGALTRMLKTFESSYFGGGPASGFDPAIAGGARSARILIDSPIIMNGSEVARLVLDEAVELTNAGQGPLSGLALEAGR